MSLKAFKFLSIIAVAELDGVSLLVDFPMKLGKKNHFLSQQMKVLFSGLRERRHLSRLLNKLQF